MSINVTAVAKVSALENTWLKTGQYAGNVMINTRESEEYSGKTLRQRQYKEVVENEGASVEAKPFIVECKGGPDQRECV